jgi:hypothetical protein
MRPLRLAICLILILLGLGPLANPAETADTPAEPPAKVKEDDRIPIQKQDEWQFFLSPYLWIPGLNITASSLKGTQGTNIPWWDTASALFSNTIGILGRAEAWKGRWGLYLDGYYTYVGASGSQVGASKDISFGPYDFTLNKQINVGGISISVPIPGKVGPGNITLTPSGSVKYISRLGNLDLGARFLVGTWPLEAEKPLPALSLELLGGPRFNSINQYVRINLSAIKIGNVPIDLRKFILVGKHQSIKNGSYVISYNNQYFEPFLGARVGFWLSPKFLVTLMGDVGGFGLVADDHVDCNFEALFGYRVSKHLYAWLGYRALGTWYNLGENLAQINFSGWAHGPVLGTTVAF